MSEFDFWQRWGIDLSDTSFANAWAALGIAAAARGARAKPSVVVARALRTALRSDGRVPWAFPPTSRFRSEPALVRKTTPEDWAHAWTAVLEAQFTPRLRIVSAPTGETILPWLRLLSQTNPITRAVALDIAVRRAHCEVAWPLRFGFITEAARGVVAVARKSWPANELSRSIALGRDVANCDVLVHCGTSRTLLSQLLERQFTIKTNLVVLRGEDSEAWGDVSSRLMAVLTEVRASGYVLLTSKATDDDLSSALVQLVGELSDAHTFDVAVARALGHTDNPSPGSIPATRTDMVAGFTDQLVQFRIPALAQTHARRLKSLPAGAEVDLGAPGAEPTPGVPVAEPRKRTTEPVTKLYVGNLPFSATKEEVRALFEQQGTIESIALIEDRETGRPRGFGFVDMPATDAARAIQALNGKDFQGRPLKVNDAQTKGGAGGARDASTAGRVPARSPAVDAAQTQFDHESGGSSDLAKVATSIEAAAIPPRVQRQRASRFLQQRSFIRLGHEFQEARHGLVVDAPTLVRVRIGPPEGQWDTLATAFPEEQLPAHLEQWSLTVWLSEPDHLPEPLRGQLKLPHDGASTECEFRFKPKALARFEARISVLHRGRVIQTAVLRSSVLPLGADAARGHPPSLEDFVPVRHAIGDLKQRRQFDLAFVLNHNAAGRSLATGLSEKHAWISDLSKSIAIAKDINNRLSPVAKSVADYEKGLDGEKGRELLVQLAQLGSYLHLYLVTEQLGATGNRPEVAQSKYLQIVSTKSDAVIPFEFIYEYQVPDDDAHVCEHWRKGLADGKCGATCDRTSGRAVCPLGFWGLDKVIERHALTPELAKEGRELYLQSETSSASSTLHLGGVGVFGASTRVSDQSLVQLSAALGKHTGKTPSRAQDWDTWLLAVHDNRPNLLLALAHTDGTGANVSLELGGKTIKSIQIKEQHVRSKDGDPRPLIALLGCDTAGTADDYGHHVAVFRARGAAIVIGTIATVFGDHAAQVGCRLVEGLLPQAGAATPERLGEALRALKRKALSDNLLMPLCLVAYGDADWKLSRD